MHEMQPIAIDNRVVCLSVSLSLTRFNSTVRAVCEEESFVAAFAKPLWLLFHLHTDFATTFTNFSLPQAGPKIFWDVGP